MENRQRIDQNTVVPLFWIIAGFAAVLSVSVAGSVSYTASMVAINFRLARIEQHLGIKSNEANTMRSAPPLTTKVGLFVGQKIE